MQGPIRVLSTIKLEDGELESTGSIAMDDPILIPLCFTLKCLVILALYWQLVVTLLGYVVKRFKRAGLFYF